MVGGRGAGCRVGGGENTRRRVVAGSSCRVGGAPNFIGRVMSVVLSRSSSTPRATRSSAPCTCMRSTVPANSDDFVRVSVIQPEMTARAALTSAAPAGVREYYSPSR